MAGQSRKSDLAAKVAWLYFVGNQTQQEIAETLHVSRPTVQRLVASAMESGFVQVRISHSTTDCMELGEQLRRRFDLGFCEVAPVEPDRALRSLRPVAVIGAGLVERYLARPGLEVLALGSGRTIKAIVDEIAAIELPRLKILSLAGVIALDGSFNRYDCGLRMADRTSGKYFLPPVPVIAPSVAEKEAWGRHPIHDAIARLYQKADAALVGIGTIGPGSPLLEDGFLTERELLELAELGAAGEILGWPLDRDGKILAAPLSERVTSLPLPQLATRPVIAFAAGARKAAAILAALRGGWISGLVTDFETAKLVLAMV
jgi:DNA-binding transcriptional regulator LsrR (DeoR family)